MNWESTRTGLVRSRQAVLRKHYLSNPEESMVTDYACTDSGSISPDHPLHNTVCIDRHNTVMLTGGLHTAVGGDSDAPTPGDILCGAIAACMDSTLRVIADGLGLVLKELRVEVEGQVDVQGTLRMNPAIPVGFQRFSVLIAIEGKTPLSVDQKRRLLRAAEFSCIVMQSLKGNPAISFEVSLES